MNKQLYLLSGHIPYKRLSEIVKDLAKPDVFPNARIPLRFKREALKTLSFRHERLLQT